MKLPPLPTRDTAVLLERTKSRCPVCHLSCPAEVWRVEGTPARVFLKRTCPAHGETSVCIASDARFYWLAKGRPENSEGCCGGGDCSSTVSALNLELPPGSACCASDASIAGTLGRNA